MPIETANASARLWVISDLHLETVPRPDGFAPRPPEFDVLVCAGDVWRAQPERGFAVLRKLGGKKPVVCVLGNHEHWNGVLGEREDELRRAALRHDVTLLQGEAVTLGGCRFVGTTLWTDYALAGEAVEPDDETGEVIHVAGETGPERLTIGATARQHRIERNRLAELIAAHDGPEPVVVVTHHAPHPGCLGSTERGTFFAGNGASDLTGLIETGRIALWVHGHVHHNIDLPLPGGTRVLCNPAGTRFGNPEFDDALVVPVRAENAAPSMEVRLATAFAIVDWFGPFPSQDAGAHKRITDEMWGEDS